MTYQHSPDRNGATQTFAAKLMRLQVEQHQHDEAYHREIARLPLQDRLRHMALHFAKYAGRLCETVEPDQVQKTAVDIFIISISTLTALNVEISSALVSEGHQFDSFDDVRERLTRQDRSLAKRENFAAGVAIFAGRMAAACEKLDHLESYPFRTSISENALNLFCLSASFMRAQQWNIDKLVESRLSGVKQKSFLHGRT